MERAARLKSWEKKTQAKQSIDEIEIGLVQERETNYFKKIKSQTEKLAFTSSPVNIPCSSKIQNLKVIKLKSQPFTIDI